VDIKKGIEDTLSKPYGECSMDLFKKTICSATLIAVFMLVAGFNASGAENSVGSGNDNWWTAYPEQSSANASEVEHPQWVLDALEKKPVVIYVHKGCSYCKPQTDAMAEVVSEYGDKFAYYDISAETSDSKAEEAIRAYDPNGGIAYVPLTAIVTLAPDSEGKVRVIWHSTDEVTGKAWIEEYVQDALSYHNENSGDWEKSEA